MPFEAGLYYQDHNIATSATSPAVVLIHGAGGNHLVWPFNIRRLPGYRVLALDLPGHGKSPAPGLQSITGYAQAVLEWLLAANLGPTVLVGHSMGAAIALQIALDNPQVATGLALLGCSIRLKVNPALITAASQAATFPDAVQTVTRWSYSPQAPAALTSLAAQRMAEIPPEVLHADFLACDAFDASGRLAEIRCPTYVICGEQDRMTPLSQVQELARQIQGSRMDVVPQAGHMVMIEQPGTVAELLARFLTEIA
jgi:pimeloyl-ACP methyl ester carboxylesterase